MAETPEGKVKRAIKQYLRQLPDTWFYMPVQNGMGVTGIPDFIVCIKGKFLGLEAKAPGREADTTPNQDDNLERIRQSGGVSAVVTSVNDVVAVITYSGLM